MSDNSFDVVFIGGGPGGYAGAIKAAQLGLKTACVEMRGSLGGTCLNVGCIPSKALLQSSHHYIEAKEHFAEHGIDGDLKLNLKAMMKRKNDVVSSLTQGIEGLFKKNKVEYIIGAGKISAAGKVAVTLNSGKKRNLKAENIVIATGSKSRPLPIPGGGVKIRSMTIRSFLNDSNSQILTDLHPDK